jgi:hypothetical protein
MSMFAHRWRLDPVADRAHPQNAVLRPKAIWHRTSRLTPPMFAGNLPRLTSFESSWQPAQTGMGSKSALPSKQENGSGDRTNPMIVRAAFGCGRDRRTVNDQIAVFVDLFALVACRLG